MSANHTGLRKDRRGGWLPARVVLMGVAGARRLGIADIRSSLRRVMADTRPPLLVGEGWGEGGQRLLGIERVWR